MELHTFSESTYVTNISKAKEPFVIRKFFSCITTLFCRIKDAVLKRWESGESTKE